MMAMTRFPLAQVAVASCLLVILSPLTAAYEDQTWANNEEIQSWLESWIHQYLPTSAEIGQQQQQQQTHYFTPDQMDYFKNLLSTMKQGSMNDDVKQEILEHMFPKGSEENVTQQEQQTTTPADSSEEIEDDSDEETSQEPQTTTPANSEEQQVKQESYTIAPEDSEEQTTQQEQQTTRPANSEEQVKQEPNTNVPSDSEEQTTPQEQQTTTPTASGEQVNEDSEEHTTPLELQTTTPVDSEESEEQVKEDSEEQTTQQEQQTTTPANSEEQVKQEPNTNVPSDSEEQTTPQEQQTTTPADSEEQAKEDSEEQTTPQEPQTTTPADSEESEEQAKEDSDEQTTPQEPQTTTPADSEEQVKQEPSTIAPEDSEEQTTQQEQQTTTPSDSEEQTTQYELQTTTSVDSEEHVKDDSEEQTTQQEQQTTTPSDSEEQTTQQELQTTTLADSDEDTQEQKEESEDEDEDSQEESEEETTSTTTAATTTTETTTTTTTTTSTSTEVITTPEATTTATTEAEPATTTTTTTTGSSTTITPSPELCDNCVVHHGVGYASFPGYCDSYIQCRYYGAVLTAVYVRRCPSGQYWSQDKLTCDFEANVNCTQVNNCPNHKAIPGDWAAYLIYNGQNWTRESCPVGRTYNSVTCGCTDRHGDDNESRDNCSDKKAIAGDKTGFFQLTGNGWVRMACPATVGYNEQTCGCTDKLPADISNSVCPYTKPVPGDRSGYLQFTGVSWIFRPCPATLVYNPDICVCTYDQTNTVDDDKPKHKTQCKAKVALNFDSDDATDSSVNHFWVNNTGVTFNNGKAYFNGKSRLTIPGLSNMDFGSTVYIIIKYKHSSANTKQTLVANGDCQVRQSLAVCSGKDSVDFYAETKEQISLGKITVPIDIGTWQYAVYSLDNGSLTGSVGANRVSQPVKGAVDRRQRGLVIGGGGDCDNFHGIIDEVQVFMCKPLM